MNEELTIRPSFEIVENKTWAYEKYKPYFKFLEALFWTKDAILTKLDKEQFKVDEYSQHQIVVLCHIVWLGGQIRGILLLLNEALNSQAAQLMRSLWEAKINLLYIAKMPEERSREFMKKSNEDLESLRKEAIRQHSEEPPAKRFLPYELTKLPEILPSEKVDHQIWNDKLFERAKDLELTFEYRSIYKTLCQPVHVSSSALTNYMNLYSQNPSFDPNEPPENIPGKLLIASMLTLQILCELNRVLKAFDEKYINDFEQELDNLFTKFNEDNKSSKSDLSGLIDLLREKVQKTNIPN